MWEGCAGERAPLPPYLFSYYLADIAGTYSDQGLAHHPDGCATPSALASHDDHATPFFRPLHAPSAAKACAAQEGEASCPHAAQCTQHTCFRQNNEQRPSFALSTSYAPSAAKAGAAQEGGASCPRAAPSTKNVCLGNHDSTTPSSALSPSLYCRCRCCPRG